jgi:membrane protease YdiL (CAAX protease family)
LTRPSINNANYLYLLTLLLGLLSTPLIRRQNFYNAVLFAESLLLIPTLIFIMKDHLNVKETLRLHWPGFRLLFLSAATAFFAYIIATFIAASTRYIYTSLGNPPPMFVPPIASLPQLGLTLLVGGLLASITEEILFRGYLLRAYEEIGSFPGVLIVGILFGMFHLSLQNLVATVFLGITMGYLVFRTNSLLAGITAHFTNNALAFLITYFNNNSGGGEVPLGPQELKSLALTALISLFILSRVFAVIEKNTNPQPITEKASIWVSLAELTRSWPLAIALVIFFTMAFSEFVFVFGPL